MNQTQPASAFAHRDTPRIFCIGRNYADHVQELGNKMAGDNAIVFMKPASALISPEESLTLPQGQGSVHYEAELVVEIGAAGSNITTSDARSHIAALGLGLDLTLRDLQHKLKAGGEPWERAKSFDSSAPLGQMTPLGDDMDLNNIEFELSIDGKIRQRGNTSHLIVGVAELLAMLSRDWTLAAGDLIYTGTPAGVGPLASGMHLTLSGPRLASTRWWVT